ncbi:hypothetical protein [Salmonella phage SD-1_S14]|nr:hypothetical protein [Salmonella phage SD-2_S15]WPK19166.1 hypothetical protein [Salmonella phage SD-6_S16]WPK19835.1 hypothetical protein [Salmonella phage SD-1_S14]WPK20862.1 hypothetical protein [Salmonella phage SD-15_S21]
MSIAFFHYSVLIFLRTTRLQTSLYPTNHKRPNVNFNFRRSNFYFIGTPKFLGSRFRMEY